MVTFETFPSPDRLSRGPLFLAVFLLVLELGAIGVIFKHGIDFRCLDVWPGWTCRGASSTLVALYCVFGGALLYGMLRPAALRNLAQMAGRKTWPLAVNALGVAVALAPLALLRSGAGQEVMLPAFAFWTLGMATLLGGLALYIAPIALWRSFLRDHGLFLLPTLLAAAMAPWIAMQLRPLWRLETISQVTFEAVAATVRTLGYEVINPPGTKIIGTQDFSINVAPQCSGVEGLALVTVFVSIYLWLFRSELRFPRALWLFPAGLIASALFNVIRISVLLIIGLEGNPELAVGGFHSHAGWLMFTLVALGVVLVSQSVPGLQKVSAAPVSTSPMPPFFQDENVAAILPFAVFMLSALLAQAFATNPGVIYPLRVAAMGSALALFWPLLRNRPWRLDPVAVAIGTLIGVIWVLIPVAPSDGPPPYGALTGVFLIIWFILRGLGTIVLVPVIEEMFFRGYLETLLRRGSGGMWKAGAAVTTAALFALLHDRWLEAFFAGLAFSWLVQRRGGAMEDAIVGHAVANAIVFGVVIATGNLAII